jgi:hypothetical protein
MSIPTFRIGFLFHADLALFERTLPRCLTALTSGTAETYEVVVWCDGTPPEVARSLPDRIAAWGVDELVVRRRERFVASGDPSNNGHRRLLSTASPYLILIEDDVVMYRTDPSFDVLASCRALFERHQEVPVLCKVDDFDKWTWRLTDLGEPLAAGVRSVNRVSTHFLAYDVRRFVPVARRFGAFALDVFIDRDDLSYNWEDLVSHVGTTGGRRIAFPYRWPLNVFHCDEKVAPGSIYHTQDPAVKQRVLDALEERFAGRTGGSDG